MPKLFQQLAACTKGKVIKSPPTGPSPAQAARTQPCSWPVAHPVRRDGGTSSTGNSATCGMAGHGPPFLPRVAQTGADIRRKGKNRIQINLAQGMCIPASGARFVQHPSIKNPWENARPSSPYPCIFCWEWTYCILWHSPLSCYTSRILLKGVQMQWES